MQPFNIQCTTCRRNLRVTSPEAIGKILSCPKCSSMVLVEAPPGWVVTQDGGPKSNDKHQETGDRSQKAGIDTRGSDFGDQKSSVKQQPSSVKNQDSAISNRRLVAADSVAKTSDLAATAPLEKLKAEKSTVWKDPPAEFAPESATMTSEATASEFSSATSSPANAVFQPAPLAAEMAAVHGWPRWFWPGVAAAVVLGVLVLSLRLMFWGGANAEPAYTNPVAPNATDQTSAESNAATATNSAPSAEAPANQQSTAPGAPATVASGGSSLGGDSPATTNSKTIAAEQSKTADEPSAAGNQSNLAANADLPTTQVPAAADVSTGDTKNVAATPSANPPANSDTSNNSSSTAPPLPIPSTDDSSAKSNAADAASGSPPSGEQQPAPRTLKRVPARTVNMNSRLADSVPGIDVQGQPLVEFLELMSGMSTVPIALDADATLDLGQTAAAPIQLHLTDASVADVLQTALEPLRLDYQLRDGQLIVGYPPQEKLRQVRYNVTDLVDGDSALVDLAAEVRRMIAPASWQEVGGKGAMMIGKQRNRNNELQQILTVEQTEPAHAQILTFCEKLRVARGLPLKSRYDPSRFVLNSREDKAQELLDKPISANFAMPTSLADAIKWVHQATGAVMVINHEALAREGTSAQSECEALAVNKPLAKLLDDLTASADLTWRAIDDRTIEITSHSAALARMDVEFYPARNLAADAAAGEKLIAEIKAKVEPQLWGDAADKLADLGAINFDNSSGALIVRAPQRIQSQVEAELAAQRGQK